MKVKEGYLNAVFFCCALGFIQFILPQKSWAQCTIQTIPNTTIYCGNSVQLTSSFEWQNKGTGGLTYYNAIWFTSVDTGYVATYDGGIKKTVNGGGTWTNLTTGNAEPIFALYFVNDSVGYAAGGNWGTSFLLKTTNAGQSWSKSVPTTLGTIKSIYFTSADTGYAVGGDDLNFGYYILKTNNGGITWNKSDSGGGFTLLSVHFVNPTTGYAAGNYGKILKTINGGSSWSLLTTGSTTHLKQVYFLDTNNGYAIGANLLLTTLNGGQSWTQKTFPSTSISFIGVYFSDILNGHLIDGYIHVKTKDGGLTWQESNIGNTQPLTNAFFVNGQTAYACGITGIIRKYQTPTSYSWLPNNYLSNPNISNPWASPKDSTTYILEATFPGACIARDTVTIGVLPVYIYLKQNNTVQCGTSVNLEILMTTFDNNVSLNYAWWPASTLNDSTLKMPLAKPVSDAKYYVTVTAPNGCSITDSTLVFVTPIEVSAGYNQMITCGDSILLSGSPKWITQSSTYNNPSSMTFTSCEIGYAVNNGIQKTSDGGKTWENKTFISGLQSVFFYNASVGYAVGDYATFLKTTNAGNSWQSYAAGNTYLRAVFFTSLDTGYVVGVTGTIRKTTNGGLTWSNQSVPTLISFNKVLFISPTIGFVIGNNGLLYKTINAGANWTLVPTGITNNLLDICKSGSNTIHIVGSNRTYITSKDGGVNWVVQTNASFWNPKSIVFTSELQGYVAGSGGAVGAIYTTGNGGLTWVLQEYRDFTSINYLCFPTPTCGYAFGSGINNKFLLYPGMADSYVWSPSLGLRDSLAPSTYAFPINSTSYVLTINKSGCIASTSVALQVYPLRINNLPDYLYHPDNICGTIFQLDTISTNDSNGVINYLWSPPELFNNPYSSHPSVKLLESRIYHLKAETWNGCIALDSVYIFTRAFSVEAGTDIYRNYNHLCGSTYQLDSVKTNTIENNLTYRWYPSTHMNDSTILNPRVTLKDDIIYHVVVTTPNGCVGHDSVVIAPFPLEIYHGNNKDAYCGLPTQLDSVRTNQSAFGPYTYNWFPITGLNQSNIPNPVTNEKNIGYKVTVSNKVGCVATDSIYVRLTKMLPPELCIVSVDSNNHNLLVWDMPPTLAVDSYYVYKESNVSGQFFQIAKLPFQLHNFFVDTNALPTVQSNKYKISLVDSCGLETSAGTPHKTMHLTINKGLGNSWNLIWNAYEGFMVNTYNIYRGSDSNSLMQIGTTAGSNNSYTDLTAPAGNLYYQVEIISPRSCALQKNINSSRSNKISNKTVGLADLSNKLDFKMYPNPVSEQLTLEWEPTHYPADVLIFTMQGKLILTSTLTQPVNTLNLAGLSSGLYVIELISDSKMGRKLLIKR